MEYLEGQTLRDRLRTLNGPLPLPEAVRIASALCDALEYAHQRGVIHRDIKPDNVHLLPDGRVKLTDFGIARITHEDSLTLDGQVFGTPSYMSPEQVVGRAIDTRSDLFSLGVVLYEMLSGRKPFTGDSVVTITYRIMHDEMPAISGLPPAMDALLRRTMAKNAEDRIHTAGELRAGLNAAARGQHNFATTAPSGLSAPSLAPSATIGYSTQTRQSVAPGRSHTTGAAGLGPPSVVGTMVHPAVPEAYARPSGSGAWTILKALLIVALTGGLVAGGGWAIKTAYQNHRLSTRQDAERESLARAVNLYNARQYGQAMPLFDRLVKSATNPDARRQATQGLLYCYRQMGAEASRRRDLAAAESWYSAAVNLAPEDAQARRELDDVLRARGAAPSTSAPSLPASPSATILPPPASAPGPVSASPTSAGNASPKSTADFQNQNAARASVAAQLLQQGDTAAQNGDMERAMRLWQQAQQQGPGSPAALAAGDRIYKYSAANPPKFF